MAASGTEGAPDTRTLVALSVPSVIVGVVSALVLLALDGLAGLLEDFLWATLPAGWGVSPDSDWWILGVLSFTGLAVGLVVWLVPGHGGLDPATTGLTGPPLNLAAVPGVALAAILGLAGGVSLGPESPIMVINTALLVGLIARLWPRIPTELVVLVTMAGTIGAMFGTPVAAALLFTGIVAGLKGGGALWDRLFLPLVAAAAGSLTMTLIRHPLVSASPIPPLGVPTAADLASAIIVGMAATLVGLAAVFLFPYIHRFFHGLRHPVIYLTLGGVVLGVLGAVGGRITLFKGSQQLGELILHEADYSAGQLILITVVKFAALLVAASAGFRGGRIFPALFIGSAFGTVAHTLIPAMPLGLAVACGILGVVLAVARDGWMALFLAVAVCGDIVVLPVLCLVILPTWLMVSRAPEMLVSEEPPRAAGTAGN